MSQDIVLELIINTNITQAQETRRQFAFPDNIVQREGGKREGQGREKEGGREGSPSSALHHDQHHQLNQGGMG